MQVSDAMTPRSDVVTAELPGTRDDALEQLQERGFSSIPVVNRTDGGEEYRGLVSRDDLIENPDEDQLALLMREVPTTVPTADIESVARTMVTGGIRRVPVVDDGLVGILTVTDVVRAIARGEIAGETPVGDLASRSVNTTYRATPLPVAERELHHADLPYAVVLDDEGEMCGMLTVVDIIAVARVVEGEEDTGESIANEDDEWMWEGIKAVGNRYLPTRNVELPSDPVETFMTADVVSVSARRTAREVARLLLSNDIEQAPLIEGGTLSGVVRDVNLLEAI